MEPENALSLGDYIAAVKRRRLLVAGIAASTIVGGAALALALPDVYRSTATFRLVTDRVAETSADRSELVDQYVFGLADKVFSSGALTSIVRDVNPYPDLYGEDGAREAASRLRRHTDVGMTTRKVLEPGGGRERMINIGFTVAFNHSSPETAERVAAALKNAFIELGRSDQLAAALSRVKFFSGEADRLSKQIAELEQRMADFKSANFDRLPESAQANITIRGRLEQELDGVDREVRTLQQNRVFIAQQLRQAQAGPAAGELRQLEEEYARKSAVYAETHPDVVALRRQIENLKRGGTVVTGNTLQAQLEQQQAVLVETRQRYSDDHPDVRRLVRTIESLQSRIAAGEGSAAGASDTLMSVQLQTQLNAMDTQIAGLQARGGVLRARLNQLDQQLGSTPEVEREYQDITRGLDSARAQYNQMIAKRLDADLEVAAINSGAADRFRLFSAPARPWEPSGPPRIGILVVSLMLSLILSLSAVVAAEVVDGNVRGTRDLRSMLGCSPLAVVPEIRNSILRRRRTRRITALATSVLLGGPILFFVVRLLAT